MLAVSCLLVTAASAQPAVVPSTLIRPLAPAVAKESLSLFIQGKTIEGKVFDLALLKGKVVLVMFWSTQCAVCRDKMPELRSNYQGWQGRPFELVAINTDVRMQDFLDYERIIASTVPLKQRFTQLWSRESGYRDSAGEIGRLPAAYLIDKNGKVVERYSGRIPSEAWDRIADLL
jgi:thiol-disulfide isomerase/thioredoxin